MQEKRYTMPEREAPVSLDVDIVVVGGGFPGVCAAVGAARAGAKVAIVERDGMLGGQAAEIYTFGIDGFVDRNGRQFVKGMQLLYRLKGYLVTTIYLKTFLI